MARVTMTFTHCDTLQKDRISDTFLATVHFELVIDGASFGPFSSTIVLGEGTPEVTPSVPTGTGPHELPPTTLPPELLRRIALDYFEQSMEIGQIALDQVSEMHPDSDDEPLLKSTEGQMTASFDIEDPPERPKRRRWWLPWRA
jgi:hypothetical protein